MRLSTVEKNIIQEWFLTSTAEEVLLMLHNVNGHSKRKLKCVIKEIDLLKAENKSREEMLENKNKGEREQLIRYRACALYYAAKTRVKEKEKRLNTKVPFDITIDWIIEKLKIGICEVSGINLHIKKYAKKEEYVPVHPQAASLDQIIPGAGYTKDNVRVICDCLNKMFSDKHDAKIYSTVKQWITKYESENTVLIKETDIKK